jgi:electron transfer flavoprotein beta subunit
MGCDDGVLISDPSLAGSDNVAAAHVLAAAVRKVGDVDLVFSGKQAIDSDTGTIPGQVARVLGWPALTLVSAISELDPENSTIQVARAVEEGHQVVASKLPAVISVIKDYGEPRYPSFMGIRKAARADIPLWDVSALEIDPPEAVVSWPQVMSPPEREITTEIIEGETPQEKAENLADKLIAEKVL